MGTAVLPCPRHSGHRWWALRLARIGALPFARAGEAWFGGNVQKGRVPQLLPPWPLGVPFSASLIQSQVGGSLVLPGIVLGSDSLAPGRVPDPEGVPVLEGLPVLGGLPVLEGPPGPAPQVRPGQGQGGHFHLGVGQVRLAHMPAQRVPWPEACTPGRPNSCAPRVGPPLPMGPAGLFHRVIKCQSPKGRQRQLPGLQIRGAKETGCAQGRETARPRTCSPHPLAGLIREWGMGLSTHL